MSEDPSQPLSWQDMLNAVVKEEPTIRQDTAKRIVKIVREATEESWQNGFDAASSDDGTPEFAVDPAVAQLDKMLNDGR
jgi:hypothetical protein